MRYILSLVFSLVLCAALAGCSDDNTGNGTSPTNNSDATDALDDAGDSGTPQDAEEDDAGGECSSDDDCDDGQHQAGVCDPGTNTCSYACDEGWADCDDDASNGCEIDTTTSTDHCGACGNSCDATSLNLLPICAEDSCDVDPDSCLQGHVDLNGDAADGCECEITDENDMPDADGQDTDCDGIDGQVAMAIFVATTGDDGNDGLTPESPVATIEAGLEAAADNGRQYLLVAGGDYTEAVTVRSGISIYGGYDAANGWARDTANQTTRIEPDADDFAADTEHFKSVSATGITDATVLDNLTIAGVDASAADMDAKAAPGASSYALWAKDSDALAIENSHIVGGKGESGKPGAVGATANCSKHQGGRPGAAGAQDSPCALPSGSTANPGTSGLPHQSGGGDGGVGGTHACKQDRSACTDALNGADGQDGTAGDHGANGQAAPSAEGSVDTGLWTASSATPAANGTKGAGGGGGGGGANCEDSDAFCGVLFCADNVDVGGAGGAGGDGGCPGTAGENGQAGGGAFSIFAVNSDLQFDAVTVDVGDGGLGGDGGDGGEGESGQQLQGGEGQNGETRHAGEGGWGGNGGNGGHGGAGAGGCGGPAIGLAMSESTIDQAGLTINQATGQAGQPGQGGVRPDGQTADDGCNGTLKASHDYSADSGS